MARTGLRLSEGLALQVEGPSFSGTRDRGIGRDRLDTFKSQHGRTVNISQQIALLRLQIELKTETSHRGWPVLRPGCSKPSAARLATRPTPDRASKRALLRQCPDAGSHRQGPGRYAHPCLRRQHLRGPHGDPADGADHSHVPRLQRTQPERRTFHGFGPERSPAWGAYTYTSSTAGTFSVTATGDGTTITVP